jgi:S1-C subfamily serine protease
MPHNDPMEYQHFGPRATSNPTGPQPGAPAWSTRPSVVVATEPRRGPRLLTVAVIALVVGIVSGSLSAVVVTNLVGTPTNAVPGGGSANGLASSVHIDESSAIVDAVQQVAPTVVKIEASSTNGLSGASGVGSGFVFDPNGWILTNKHVVAGAAQLTVQLEDTRRFTATVYGIDPLTDLAIVKIEATGLPAAPIGSSANLLPGQLAIAIGNPLGDFADTVTTGVVSGLGRQITAGDATQSTSEQLNNLIQTDAAINPGNSGGPLLNSGGQVIGVNTAVSQDAQGIGFAIPIDYAKPIMGQALRGQPLTRPWIGVYYQPVTRQLALDRGLAVDHGALLLAASDGSPAIFPNSPAARAGLREGDVILSVDNQVVDSTHDLSALVIPYNPGDRVTLNVLRGGSTISVVLTLGTLPSSG